MLRLSLLLLIQLSQLAHHWLSVPWLSLSSSYLPARCAYSSWHSRRLSTVFWWKRYCSGSDGWEKLSHVKLSREKLFRKWSLLHGEMPHVSMYFFVHPIRTRSVVGSHDSWSEKSEKSAKQNFRTMLIKSWKAVLVGKLTLLNFLPACLHHELPFYSACLPWLFCRTLWHNHSGMVFCTYTDQKIVQCF